MTYYGVLGSSYPDCLLTLNVRAKLQQGSGDEFATGKRGNPRIFPTEVNTMVQLDVDGKHGKKLVSLEFPPSCPYSSINILPVVENCLHMKFEVVGKEDNTDFA